jgi:hypothetical protein
MPLILNWYISLDHPYHLFLDFMSLSHFEACLLLSIFGGLTSVTSVWTPNLALVSNEWIFVRYMFPPSVFLFLYLKLITSSCISFDLFQLTWCSFYCSVHFFGTGSRKCKSYFSCKLSLMFYLWFRMPLVLREGKLRCSISLSHTEKRLMGLLGIGRYKFDKHTS